MLQLSLESRPDCEGLRRREFLQIGGLTALGLGLPDILRAEAGGASARRGRINCILLWMQGGPSHLDMFDPKPDAPSDIRGEFGVVRTTDPAVYLSEHLPKLAQNFDKFSILRGADPKNGSHGVADYMLMTGHKFNPSVVMPCFGSTVAKELGYKDGMLPFVQLGNRIDRRFNGGVAGILGDQFNPFEVNDDPNNRNFRVRDLSIGTDAEAARLERRQHMLDRLERFQTRVEAAASPAVDARSAFYEKAFSLITSPRAKRAFDLEQEPPRLRDDYGRHTLGQSCLLARRLIESGVRFVTVTDGGWDTHQNNFRALRESRLPRLDQAYAALLRDLEARGLLDTTLVVWMGDFGRTPKINSSAGRDHWATAGTVCMGGGGVKTGIVHGRTNALGEFVTDGPVTPADLAATIYHALGIPLDTWYQAPDGRPLALVPEGHVVHALLA
jgi:hypothetical protein